MRMKSKFENKLNENKVQFARIKDHLSENKRQFVRIGTKTLISFYVTFKIETQNTLFVNVTQTFETEIEQNLCFCP